MTTHHCKNCSGTFSSRLDQMEHIQFVKECEPTAPSNVKRRSFGDEDIEAILHYHHTFGNVYQMIQMNKHAIIHVIDYIYFNNRFPQNQTMKYDRHNKNIIHLRTTNDVWEQHTLVNVANQIFQNVENIYIAFIHKLIAERTHLHLIVNASQHIQGLLQEHFGWKCEGIIAVEQEAIASNDIKHNTPLTQVTDFTQWMYF
uniref:Uncharacterized protein n=1 Tax=Pyramimonas orientalis virus TaxID=455367 RepID=A0A7M3UPC1_POV01|nr:hypothetical protein HWQ62_00471 [Pyramimonas orientalis virus]